MLSALDMKLLCFCLLFYTVTSLVNADKIWKDCSTDEDKTRATIQDITVDPDVPKKGEDLTIKATFTLKENITKGSKAEIEAKLDGIKLYTGSFELCDEVGQVNLTCPLSAKQYNISVKTKIPELAPRGKYSATAKAMDQNGKEFACIEAEAKLE